MRRFHRLVHPATIVVGVLVLAMMTAVARAEAPALPSEGHLLVLNKADDTLMVFDTPSNSLLATIKVGHEPHEVAVTPNGRKAYVSNVGDHSLSVVDLTRNVVTKTVRPERVDKPHGLAITPDGHWLLLTSEGSHRVYLLSVARDSVERVITTTQSGTHMIALSSDGRRAWLANRESDTLTEYEVSSLKLLRTLKVGPGPEGIAASPNGRWVVTALQNAGQVAVVDAGRGQVATRLPAGQVPIRVAFPPRSPIALVTNRGSDDVTILDLAARHVIETVPLGMHPGGVVTNQRGNRAYIALSQANSVSIIMIPGWQITGAIPTGSGPDGLAFVPPPPAATKGQKAPKAGAVKP
jgi:YVTN family beta-propeller protein